jgi:endonuclease YncB( thermonuclease family)
MFVLIALLLAPEAWAEVGIYRTPDGRLLLTDQAPALPQKPPPSRGTVITGQVVGISDGDTIEVLHEGRPVKIRLYGIDAPEHGQAFGTKAQQFTTNLAHRRTVTVTVPDIDRYGRLVREVRLPDGRSLNRELVRAGLARWYQQYAPHDTTLQQLEAEAKAAKRGLWSDPNAVAPWEHRQVQRHEESQTTSAGSAERGGRTIESDGRTIYTGPRGGKYTLTPSGNKEYIPRKR